MTKELYRLLETAEVSDSRGQTMIQIRIGEMISENFHLAMKKEREATFDEIFVRILINGPVGQLTANYPAIAILAGVEVDWSLVA